MGGEFSARAPIRGVTPTPLPRKVRRLAARNHGRLSYAQLLQAGATRHQVATWTRQGWIEREHRGVYRVDAGKGDRRGTFAAALTAVGPGTTLSFRAAGGLWEVLGGAVPTEVTVPTSTGRGHRRGIIVHRSDLPCGHVTTRHGLRVTTLVRTILDLAAVLTPAELDRAFEEAQVRHGLKPEAVAAEVLCRGGYRGSPKLRALLADAVDPEGVASILELRFLKLCEDHGIPRPLVNRPFAGVCPDFRWPDVMVVVETDSRRFHDTVAARRRDAKKDALLEALGYTVVRLRWREVTADPAAAAARVRAALGLDG